ncbi:MyfA/PsaA family fimbrial adhesin [Escherichia coli]|uniref:MyfA/PsaA family fimbrial adhesin n=1 Tax=Escherichia coli TaxID=562 RepID=UPI0010CB57E8|nr:MyfA/PsaA family fimbrial adhesin [Escherichia coli]GCR40506.1 Fimbrial protein MyfA [Escherichia coli]
MKKTTLTYLMLTFVLLCGEGKAESLQNFAPHHKTTGSIKVVLKPSTQNILSGAQKEDTTMFVLKISDFTQNKKHSFRLIPTGRSLGWRAYNDSFGSVQLTPSDNSAWHSCKDGNGWCTTKQEIEPLMLNIPKGTLLRAGQYRFSGVVEEYD